MLPNGRRNCTKHQYMPRLGDSTALNRPEDTNADQMHLSGNQLKHSILNLTMTSPALIGQLWRGRCYCLACISLPTIWGPSSCSIVYGCGSAPPAEQHQAPTART